MTPSDGLFCLAGGFFPNSYRNTKVENLTADDFFWFFGLNYSINPPYSTYSTYLFRIEESR